MFFFVCFAFFKKNSMIIFTWLYLAGAFSALVLIARSMNTPLYFPPPFLLNLGQAFVYVLN